MERKAWKIECPTYYGIFSPNYLTIAAKIPAIL
mgnify:CR=1 FL=1